MGNGHWELGNGAVGGTKELGGAGEPREIVWTSTHGNQQSGWERRASGTRLSFQWAVAYYPIALRAIPATVPGFERVVGIGEGSGSHRGQPESHLDR